VAETIFSKIIRREIPADIVYEDEQCLAFRDINPQAPVHILIIPREELEGLQTATSQHGQMLGHLLLVAARLAEQEGIAGSGYRCVVNAGPDGGQTVYHLHVHLLGGRHLEWPPG
jgi:histidine triad (HIT) family protein